MKNFALLILITLSVMSCSDSSFDNKEANNSLAQHYYTEEIQPIFDNKCIACHSCFNSPCQLNLSSYEGVSRGANQTSIYDFPKFKARKPTRLYIDASETKQWRKKGFYDVTKREGAKSLIETMIHDLPGIESQLQKDYHSENSRVCMPDNSGDSLDAYKALNPAGRMPYGLPRLKSKEKQAITNWIDLGAPGPDTYDLERKLIQDSGLMDTIQKWEKFFNRDSMKAQLSSRYIYEHLFLASLYFSENPKFYFRLTRSLTQSGPIKEVSTSFPFGKARGDFTYRIRPITNTIMHKHHIPFPLNDQKMDKWNKSFYQSKWSQIPNKMPPYGRAGANPYKTFASIPAKARYEFMLDEAGYHVMTFIKGPVCRGQTALNVINDHFWVMFVDPSKDVISNHPEVYKQVADTTVLPAQAEDSLEPFIDFRKKYWKSVKERFKYMKDETMSEKWLWKGEDALHPKDESKRNTNALLTVFRHFNSAKVLRGQQGRIPKTLWVIDYHIFESIYYNLTASYNVFGPLMHQLHSRLYMEISRMSSEDLFLSFLPKQVRIPLREQWSQPVPKDKESIYKRAFDFVTEETEKKMNFEYPYQGQAVKTSFHLPLKSAKEDFINKHLSKIFSKKQQQPRDYAPIPSALKILTSFKGEKLKFFPDSILIRLKKENQRDEIYTLIRNKDHYNVSMLFFEQDRRREEQDTVDIIPGVATSYPNLYVVIPEDKLKDFSKMLEQTQSAIMINNIIEKFSIKRSHIDFWKHHKWFSEHTYNALTNETGHLDLNRYQGLY